MEDLLSNNNAHTFNTKNLNSKNSRIKLLASQLSVIHISLNPPSPSPPPETNFINSESPINYDENYISSFYSQNNFNYQIDDFNLLQVPGNNDILNDAMPRQHSPPPRRLSYASTTLENSLNNSYQNLLSTDEFETSPPTIDIQRNFLLNNKCTAKSNTFSALVCFI